MIKPPMFNREVEKSEEAEGWLSGMKNYFQIYNYSDRLKYRMGIYNLTRKANIWWIDIKRVKNLKEKYVTRESLRNTSKGNSYLNNIMKKELKCFMILH